MRTAKHEELLNLVENTLTAYKGAECDDIGVARAMDKLQAHLDEDYYTQKPTTEDVVAVLESNINNILFDPTEVVKLIARWHRTLQQSFTSLCLCWIAHLASLKEYEYDGRNEAGVIAARSIKGHCDREGIYLGKLPTV